MRASIASAFIVLAFFAGLYTEKPGTNPEALLVLEAPSIEDPAADDCPTPGTAAIKRYEVLLGAILPELSVESVIATFPPGTQGTFRFVHGGTYTDIAQQGEVVEFLNDTETYTILVNNSGWRIFVRGTNQELITPNRIDVRCWFEETSLGTHCHHVD